MSKKRMTYLFSAMTVFTVAYFAWKLTARSAYESAEYTVLESDGPFEIREYADLMMATTPQTRFELRGGDGSFMRLFRYISGANDGEQKIAMTTPVFLDPADEDTPGKMGFVMPRTISKDRVPAPSSDEIEIQKRKGGRFAANRFSGRMDRTSVDDAEKRLRSWMSDKALIGVGEAEYAGYDPPWTPGLLRRNEILIRLN